MSDLRDRIIDRIDRALDAMAEAPRMFGSPECLEAQALMLIELRCFVLRPRASQENPGEVQDAYERFLEEVVPGESNTWLSATLTRSERQHELAGLIQRFRARAEEELQEET